MCNCASCVTFWYSLLHYCWQRFVGFLKKGTFSRSILPQQSCSIASSTRREPENKLPIYSTAIALALFNSPREGVKKWIFYGKAYHKHLPPHPPLRSAFCDFFCVCDFYLRILGYDSMCSEMDFTPEKLFKSNYECSKTPAYDFIVRGGSQIIL